MPVKQLHFDLAHLDQAENYTFRHSLYSVPLKRHTAETRRRATAALPFLALVPEKNITHFVDADLPDTCICLMTVTKPSTVGGQPFDHPVHMAIHIPDKGQEHVRQQQLRARNGGAAGLHPKLARHRPSTEAIRRLADSKVDPQYPEHISTYQDATDGAVALLFHHGSLINLNMDNGGAVPQIIIDECILPAMNLTGELQQAILDARDAWLESKVVNGVTVLQPSADVMEALTGPLQVALVTSQNLASLEGQQWRKRYGVTTAPYDGTSGSGSAPTMRATLKAEARGWVAKNITAMNGLTVDGDSIVYTPPTGTPTWTAGNHWLLSDTPSLTPAIAELIKAGKVVLQITDAANPQGALRGNLVPGPEDASGLIPLTVTLTTVSGATTTASATATFSLNKEGTGLTYTISVQNAASAKLYAADNLTGAPLYELPLVDTTSTGTLSFDVTNDWLRHLSACVQYLDTAGNVLEPKNWSSKIPAFLRATFEPDSKKPFVALIPPVTTVFGVPIPADPTTITIPVWDEVHTVRLLLGGLGRGSYDSAVCPIGITVTALSELALPPFLLLAGTAIMESDTVKKLMANKPVLFAVCAAGTFLAAGPTAAYIGLSQDPGGAAKGLAEQFGPMLLSPATELGLWVAGKFAEGAVQRAVPFVNLALEVIDAAVTAAELIQTIVEVLDSPFVYEADISRSMELEITLQPDPRFNKFPDYHDKLTVTVVYDTKATLPLTSPTLPPTTLSDPIKVPFQSVPVGGRLRVYACFFAKNGWQSGQAISDWIDARPTGDGTKLIIDNLVVETNEIPLTTSSVYQHQEKIAFQDGKLIWQAAVGQPPTQTVTSASPFAADNKEVLRFASITTAQEPEMLGYSWQATGLGLPPDRPGAPVSNEALWTLQNISVLEHPQAGYAAPAVGFTQIPGIAYNMASGDGEATNFFIDSSNPNFDVDANPTGGWHVRALSLSHAGPPPTFAAGTGQSYGRFPVAIDRYVYHPCGDLFGISFGAHKLFRLTLAKQPVADKDAPFAVMSAGQGLRDGLMMDPVGIAVALDGRILVLESGNQRVQAFDTYGNAVPYFANPTRPRPPKSPERVPIMALQPREHSTYLDISVESQGYIYVLSYTGDGSQPSMYQVDLYEPWGEFMVTTPNVAAARMVVNVLRDLYTLNYELFLDGAGRVQPSISMWLPPPP